MASVPCMAIVRMGGRELKLVACSAGPRALLGRALLTNKGCCTMHRAPPGMFPFGGYSGEWVSRCDSFCHQASTLLSCNCVILSC